MEDALKTHRAQVLLDKANFAKQEEEDDLAQATVNSLREGPGPPSVVLDTGGKRSIAAGSETEPSCSAIGHRNRIMGPVENYDEERVRDINRDKVASPTSGRDQRLIGPLSCGGTGLQASTQPTG